MKSILIRLCFLLAMGVGDGPLLATGTEKAPFKYIWGEAQHILSYTTSDESGYFSLCEGLNGKLYVGTAQYNYNAYLVEFDPKTKRQRIVIDTRKLCGLQQSGYAAQAKIHTRNFVGRSGTIYVGSKQGYRNIPGDSSEYPGGYLMAYDPRKDSADCLGLPYPKEGIIDVAADETRGLIYIVTCEEQHFVIYDSRKKIYREPEPSLRLTPYATALIDSRGRANVITKEFKIAQYDPETDTITTRDIQLAGKKWVPEPEKPVPTWNLADDGKTAYLLNMSDPNLYDLDIGNEGASVPARSLGKRIDGEKPDSRNSLAIAPDGRVYTLVRIQNDTGFGKGFLHHLTRYTPKTGKMEDLGVIAVKNPDYFDWSPLWNGKPKPWTNGFPTLPDGTMTPLHVHMSLIVAKNGTMYATFLAPFTLLKIDPVR